MYSGLGFYDKDIILLFKAIQKHVEWHVWHSEHQWSALFSPDTKRNKFSGQLAELFLPWLRGHGPNHWNIGRRRVHRISQGFRSVLVITCQPKISTPTSSSEDHLAPRYPLNVSVDIQLEECNYSFFTRLEGTVYFLGAETNLT